MEHTKHELEYKEQLFPKGARIYGHVLTDHIKACQPFWDAYVNTLRRKKDRYSLYETVDGINVCMQGGEIRLMLRFLGFEHELEYCPFCGAKMEIIKGATVRLKRRYKNVFDGYDEELVSG